MQTRSPPALSASHILDWSKRERETVGCWPKNKPSLTLPIHSANEKAAVQPIIAALLRALSEIGNGINGNMEVHGQDADRKRGVAAAAAPPDAASQYDDGEDEAVDGNSDETTANEQRVLVRADIRKERYIPAWAGQGTKRFVDFDVNELMAFNPYLLPHETAVLVEAKNIMRGGKTAEATHREALNRCARHLAKRTLVAFNMGGVGVDLKSVALIITPVYVEVITMTLLFVTEPPTEPNKHVDLTVTLTDTRNYGRSSRICVVSKRPER